MVAPRLRRQETLSVEAVVQQQLTTRGDTSRSDKGTPSVVVEDRSQFALVDVAAALVLHGVRAPPRHAFWHSIEENLKQARLRI